MTHSGNSILDNILRPILAADDKLVCNEVAELLQWQRHPVCALTADNPLVARYYARLLCEALPVDQYQVQVCPQSAYGSMDAFLSRLLKRTSIGEATSPGIKMIRLLLFRQAHLLGLEELSLLMEMQKSFPGLGLAYMLIGQPVHLADASGRVFRFGEAVAAERLSVLARDGRMRVSTRRRLMRLLAPSPGSTGPG